MALRDVTIAVGDGEGKREREDGERGSGLPRQFGMRSGDPEATTHPGSLEVSIGRWGWMEA